MDTPGQIEAFTWSASGQLIAESLASTFATNVVYVVDTPRTLQPATFMSNMVYACSILHKYRLPLTAAFNKVDAEPATPLFTWMDDFEAFHEALDAHSTDSPDGAGYVTSLHRSMSLVLDEFYRVLERVAVSAVSGEGVDDLYASMAAARAKPVRGVLFLSIFPRRASGAAFASCDVRRSGALLDPRRRYDATYGAEIDARIKQRRAEREAKQAADSERLAADYAEDPNRPPTPPGRV